MEQGTGEEHPPEQRYPGLQDVHATAVESEQRVSEKYSPAEQKKHGECVGVLVGCDDGCPVGFLVGLDVGCLVGCLLG